jgi:hypothetical protein
VPRSHLAALVRAALQLVMPSTRLAKYDAGSWSSTVRCGKKALKAQTALAFCVCTYASLACEPELRMCNTADVTKRCNARSGRLRAAFEDGLRRYVTLLNRGADASFIYLLLCYSALRSFLRRNRRILMAGFGIAHAHDGIL